MKTSVLTAIFILVHTGLCFGQEQIEANLSRFIYSIPVMEGMQQQGNADQVKYAIGKGIDVGVVTKVFHSKEGRHISAEEICQFYYDHFTSLEFRAWQEPANLSGRYMAPRIAINKDAHIFCQGHISFWIPKEGNSVTFSMQQRRDFNIQKSQPLLDTINTAFEKVAAEFSYEPPFTQANTMISDWPKYWENEYFVDRVVINLRYGETASPNRGGIGSDDQSFKFYCTILPTTEHAQQWRDKIIEDYTRIRRWPDWFEEGAAMEPVAVKNIVVEYKGETRDKDAPEFGKRLTEELGKIEVTN
ncbi:MAG: hypothetical protein GXY41_03320 [Phycisphaerae bacterium]|nr:hypothetical protein [Phycisphaerae bacterium]